jgi:cysteine synthase B
VLRSIDEAIGGTPLVRLRLPGLPAAVELWAKCEWFNPGGSVKDRTALSIVREGERSGALRPGKTIVDSSSGNTAVGLALVGRARGYAVELVMPRSVSEQRRRLSEAYGATIVWTDAFSGSDGAMLRVREMVAAEPDRYFYADQYRNPANPLAHYRTTGPEIFEQTEGRITHFVAGLGTTGTLVGAARYLRERNPRIETIGVEPDEPLHGLEGLKHLPSAIVPEIWDARAAQRTLRVSTEDGLAACASVMASDGLFVGHSAGAALHAARQVARDLTRGVVVALLPDGGDRYLATGPR